MSSVVHDVPMWRFTERIVRSGLVIAWRLATSPTRTSPALLKATTDGVVREPSELGMTTGSPPSRTATTELVVPRSMPTALAMLRCSCVRWMGAQPGCCARATQGSSRSGDGTTSPAGKLSGIYSSLRRRCSRGTTGNDPPTPRDPGFVVDRAVLATVRRMGTWGIEAERGEVGLEGERRARIDRHFQRYIDDGRLPGWLICVS